MFKWFRGYAIGFQNKRTWVRFFRASNFYNFIFDFNQPLQKSRILRNSYKTKEMNKNI